MDSLRVALLQMTSHGLDIDANRVSQDAIARLTVWTDSPHQVVHTLRLVEHRRRQGSALGHGSLFEARKIDDLDRVA